MSKHGNTHEESSSSVLDELLLAEHEAAERLARAEAAAAALMATATTEVDAWARQTEAALDAELFGKDAAHEAALGEMEREVAESAAHTVTRYRTVSDAVVTRLAAMVLSDVAGLSMPPTQADP